MENRLNKAILEIEVSGIRQFNNMANQIDDCVKFTLGEPNFNSDYTIKRAVKKAIDKNMTHYSPNAGLLELRKKISDDIYLRYGAKYDSDEICVCVGASEALTVTLQTILNPKDEVIVFEPAYPAYQPLIKLNNATYIPIDTCDDQFQINKNKLQNKINKNTKAIILTSPNNPTGCAYNKDSLNTLYECVKDKDIFIICDNIYDEIVFEDIENFVCYQEIREKIILIQSFSKTYAMAGYRLGYVCADYSILKHILKTHSYFVSGATTFVQYAAINALHVDNKKMVQEYKKRRDYAIQRFENMHLDITIPQGAFYFFINIEKYHMNSYDFAYQLLHKNKVCVVPGRYFGEHCDHFIRLSYACSQDDLEKGLDRLEQFINQL